MSTPTQTIDPPSALRGGATTTMGVLGVVTLVAIAVQIALAGLGAFGGGFGPHRTLGTIIGLLTVLMLIAALLARTSTAGMLLAAALFILTGPVQPILASAGDDHPWVGALHGLNAVIIFGLTGRVSFEALRRRARYRAAASDPAAPSDRPVASS